MNKFPFKPNPPYIPDPYVIPQQKEKSDKMKTPEQMAEQFAKEFYGDGKHIDFPDSQTFYVAGYQAAKDEEATKDQKIAELWTESIKKMLPSVHEIVLFPSDSAKANKARDAEIVAKMDAPVKRAKDQLADAEKMMPQWISVNERLPEYDQLALLWQSELQAQFVGRRRDSGLAFPLYYWECTSDFFEAWKEIYYPKLMHQGAVSHWMPLPEPPEGKE